MSIKSIIIAWQKINLWTQEYLEEIKADLKDMINDLQNSDRLKNQLTIAISWVRNTLKNLIEKSP